MELNQLLELGILRPCAPPPAWYATLSLSGTAGAICAVLHEELRALSGKLDQQRCHPLNHVLAEDIFMAASFALFLAHAMSVVAHLSAPPPPEPPLGSTPPSPLRLTQLSPSANNNRSPPSPPCCSAFPPDASAAADHVSMGVAGAPAGLP